MNAILIETIKQKALEDKVPIMEDESLKYVVSFLKENNVTSLLEIGTAVGYSSICFASSNPELRIVTLEIDEKRYNIAQKNISLANLEDRITAILTDAREYDLDEKFDVLFLDNCGLYFPIDFYAQEINSYLIKYFVAEIRPYIASLFLYKITHMFKFT